MGSGLGSCFDNLGFRRRAWLGCERPAYSTSGRSALSDGSKVIQRAELEVTGTFFGGDMRPRFADQFGHFINPALRRHSFGASATSKACPEPIRLRSG